MKFRILHPGTKIAGTRLPNTRGAIVDIEDTKLIELYLKAIAVELVDEPPKRKVKK